MVYSAAGWRDINFPGYFTFLEALRIQFIVCFRRCRNFGKGNYDIKAKEEGIGELKKSQRTF